ncbi:MAG: retropepsin-like aspartic protease family protein, partial [Bradyrhizobium sp.]
MIFVLLSIVILGLGGALLFALFGGESLDAIQGLPVAASVIGVLILLYLATLHGSGSQRRFGQLPA